MFETSLFSFRSLICSSIFRLYVKLGDVDIRNESDGREGVDIEGIVKVHPDYRTARNGQAFNDVAIIQLVRPVQFQKSK